MRITLYGRIPSKKNSKNIIKRWWRTFIVSSKEYIKWEKEQIEYLWDNQTEILEWLPPYKIEYNFYLPDKRKTDLSNKVESINDMLVKFWCIEDDNCEIIQELHIYFKWVDKENPRCEIDILKLK
jgi:Holliday junction resolvase RusA-like endonuclease